MVILFVIAALVRLVDWIPRAALEAREQPIVAAAVVAVGALVALPSAARLRARARRALVESTPRMFAALLFLATVTSTAAASWLALDATPFLDDDVAALFQARIFASGAVTLPLPPEPEFFRVFGVLGEGIGRERWCGMYPPGWPALLAIGVVLGAPWLVNPVLAGALAVVTARLGERLFDRTTGRLAGVVLVASPLLLGLAATHLSHIATALFVAIAFAAVLRLMRDGLPLAGLVAGAALGGAFLCRPLDAVLLGVVFAVPMLASPRLLRDRALGIALGIAAVGVAAVLLFLFQATTTGDPFVPGHRLGMGRYGRFGFMPLWGDRQHDAWRALEHTGLRLSALDRGSLGGLVPASLAILLAFSLGRGERGKLFWLAAAPGVLASAYAFFWYFDMYVPGRYLSASIPMVMIAAARGFVLAAESVRAFAYAHAWSSAVAASTVLWAVSIGVPAQFRLMLDRVGDVEPVLARVVDAYGIRNAVVFMDAVDLGRNDADFRNDFYATGFVRNRLDLAGDVVYARNLREENRRLLARYPGRDAYLYRYHRRERKALLYRLTPCDEGFALAIVEPMRHDLVIAGPDLGEQAVRCPAPPPSRAAS